VLTGFALRTSGTHDFSPLLPISSGVFTSVSAHPPPAIPTPSGSLAPYSLAPSTASLPSTIRCTSVSPSLAETDVALGDVSSCQRERAPPNPRHYGLKSLPFREKLGRKIRTRLGLQCTVIYGRVPQAGLAALVEVASTRHLKPLRGRYIRIVSVGECHGQADHVKK
jgi:hypothetical protein